MPDNNKYQIVEDDYDNVSLTLHDAYDSSKEFSVQWHSFIHHLKPASKILTVGGSLAECSYLYKLGFNVSNIDISQRMLEHIKTSNPQITTINANIKDFNEGRYDAVWACRSLIHIPQKDLPQVINNIVGLTTPDGIIGIVMFTTTRGKYDEQMTEDPLSSKKTFYYRILYSTTYLLHLFSKYGRIINQQSCVDADNEPCVYIEIKKQV